MHMQFYTSVVEDFVSHKVAELVLVIIWLRVEHSFLLGHKFPFLGLFQFITLVAVAVALVIERFCADREHDKTA